MFAVQPHHQRDEVEPVGVGFGHQTLQIAAVMGNVGVREQHVAGCRQVDGRVAQPFAKRPQLARPAGRQR